MNKCHTNIGWHNDTTPAINETNLNYMDGCIDTIDDRVVAMDTSKANQSDLLKAFKDVSLNTTTGVITFTLFDNTTKTIDTLLEKVAINFDYDDNPSSAHYQNLIIELEDGTYKYIDMSALITEYEFATSDTIAFTVGQDGAVSANVRDGSITGAKLQPNYLADVTAQANIASGAATTATNKATLAESYAVGGTGTRAGEDTDNAKYYKEQAQAIAAQQLGGLTDVTITSPQNGQALIYDSSNQEWVNGDGSIIAEREVSPATKAHSVGDYINIANVTYEVTASISIGDTLTIGTNIAVATLSEGTEIITFGSAIYKRFDECTDAEIAQYVALADAGLLDLEQDCGWAVGQEHQISLSAINSSGTYDGVTWSVGESHSAQAATLVLMHKGLYELVTPVLDKQGQARNTCSFVVGLKDGLSSKGYMNGSNTNSGSWNGCARRKWCNGGFRSALPSTLRSAFKLFKTITASEYNASTTTTSNDYFALAAEKEVVGTIGNANATESNSLTLFSWYSAPSNRIKLVNGTAAWWFERSPVSNNSSTYCCADGNGNVGSANALSTGGISPFGCI